ncbi:MAG: hypothetical protein VX899_20815 [Myxococcota bacterium]|nr:hypothetical protein [Myxococcota bacterium]
MSDLAGQTTQQLFNKWRSGDAQAGQVMAQRFSDWYYAISASRLGDRNCRSPLERACQRFAQGVASVTEARQLPGWAHGIIAEEIQVAGGRVQGGDHPNALTGQRSPTELLQQVAPHLTPQQRQLLALSFDTSSSLEEVKTVSDAAGGYPLAVLQARYALKRALRDKAGVAFTEVPEKANLDWGPLPLYEGGRMSEGKEEQAFETWMLSDLVLCKDIAEFAAFALALRGGAYARYKVPEPEPTPAPKVADAPAPKENAPAAPAAEAGGKSKTPLIAAAVFIFMLVAVAVVFFLR